MHRSEAELSVPPENRYWLNAHNVEEIREKIWAAPIDITYGGWGQDGHIAYNQTRRHPYSQISLEELRNSTVRVQENNLDTIHGPGPAHLWSGLPVCTAHVGHPGDQGMPFGQEGAPVQ